jgi:hypothetical protein
MASDTVAGGRKRFLPFDGLLLPPLALSKVKQALCIEKMSGTLT